MCREGYANSEERLILCIADCHLNGTWQPNPTDLCDINSDNKSQSSPGETVNFKFDITINTLIILRSFLSC